MDSAPGLLAPVDLAAASVPSLREAVGLVAVSAVASQQGLRLVGLGHLGRLEMQARRWMFKGRC